MSSGPITAATVVDEAGFHALQPEWDALFERTQCSTPFLSHGWMWAWWRHFGRRRAGGRCALRLITLRRGGELVGIAPLLLLRWRRFGLSLNVLEFLSSVFADYTDVLLAADRELGLQALLDHLAGMPDWSVANLRNFPAVSPTPALLERAARQAGMAGRIRGDAACPYLPPADWRSLLRRQSKSSREVLRRRLNRISRDDIRFRMVLEPQREPGLVRRLAQVERRKTQRGVPVLHVLFGNEQFFQEVIDELGPRGLVYVALYEKGERLVAYEFGFRIGGRLLAYAKAYDPEFASYSCGTMLVGEVADYVHRHGYLEYDLLRNEQPHKKRWTALVRQNQRVHLWRRDPLSRMAAVLYLRCRPQALRLLSRSGFRYTPEWDL